MVVLSIPMNDELKLELGYCQAVISPSRAELLMEWLCCSVTGLVNHPDMLLSSIIPQVFDDIKMPGLNKGDAISVSIPLSSLSPLPSPLSSELLTSAEHNRLRLTWCEVLVSSGASDTTSQKDLESIKPCTSFFSLPGADIVSASILASRLQSEGYCVTIEEIIDHDLLER